MNRQKKFLLYFLIGTCLSRTVHASWLRNPYEGIRPLGMGNAFIALSDDSNALWYNPAKLNRRPGFHFDLFNFVVGGDSMDTYTRLLNALLLGDTSNLIRTDTEFLRFNYIPTISLPNFSLAFFTNAQSFTDLQNLMGTDVDIYANMDFGVRLGFALPLGDNLSLGIAATGMYRIGLDETIPTAQLLAEIGIPAGNFLAAVFQNLMARMGSGYGVGLQVGLSSDFIIGKGQKASFAATVDDLGETTFFPLGSGKVPHSIRHSYNFGGALRYDVGKGQTFNIALDYRNAFDAVSLVNQIHFGVEYKSKVFSARAGLYQGYPTFGLGLETPPHTRIQFATYAAELGTTAGQRGMRFYLFQAIIGFNPF